MSMKQEVLFFFPAGLVVFVHAEPFVWEAEFLQRSGHLRAVGRRGGKHHRHAVLVQRQHRRGALAQVQQQSHAGDGEKNNLKIKFEGLFNLIKPYPTYFH